MRILLFIFLTLMALVWALSYITGGGTVWWKLDRNLKVEEQIKSLEI